MLQTECYASGFYLNSYQALNCFYESGSMCSGSRSGLKGNLYVNVDTRDCKAVLVFEFVDLSN